MKFIVVAVFLVEGSSILCSCSSVWFVYYVIMLLSVVGVCLVYLMHMALYCSVLQLVSVTAAAAAAACC